ncbi:hypothetical protein CSC94_21755 [Zhengella mangrovi]|uniref:Uncharacterized protein n=1 Tax=Zhengella mangrovi TaxID=1982044 RepID=A0A2G1QHM6_9HYPH|nr:hypothetical protein [Zhengella mangrovi]PHP64961.1 hypothetical protein CSC94_21755 [Zhengella mangrovi]
MSENANPFQPVEIDEVDRKLAETATRKRIPSLSVSAILPDDAAPQAPIPAAKERPVQAPRKPLSIEIPDYLARELKIAAATQAVTLRHIVLSALMEAGYTVKPADMEEDGRRLR